MLAIIVSYIFRKSLGAIGVIPSKAVRIARHLAWLVIEAIVVIAFLYIIAFIAASVGMYVVEKQTETRQVDTIHGVSFKKYNVEPKNK